MKKTEKPPAQTPIKQWIRDNYGALSKIAKEHGVSVAHAYYVMNGIRQSRDLRIERALKALGCPIVRKIN